MLTAEDRGWVLSALTKLSSRNSVYAGKFVTNRNGKFSTCYLSLFRWAEISKPALLMSKFARGCKIKLHEQLDFRSRKKGELMQPVVVIGSYFSFMQFPVKISPIITFHTSAFLVKFYSFSLVSKNLSRIHLLNTSLLTKCLLYVMLVF